MESGTNIWRNCQKHHTHDVTEEEETDAEVECQLQGTSRYFTPLIPKLFFTVVGGRSLKSLFYLNLAFANAVQQLRKLGTTEV